jgi:hypothetical protein
MIHIFEVTVYNGSRQRIPVKRFAADKAELDLIRKEMKEKYQHYITLSTVDYNERRKDI